MNIGEGTYGVVFKCLDHVTKEFVAVKRIKAGARGSNSTPGLHISAVRELKVLTGLRSEFLVSLNSVFVENGQLHLVLPFFALDLKKAIKRYGPQLTQSVGIGCVMKMLLAGLAHMHARFLAHRDLKPDNVLVCTRTGIVKITDFGLSRKVCFGEAVSVARDRAGEMGENLHKATWTCATDGTLAEEAFAKTEGEVGRGGRVLLATGIVSPSDEEKTMGMGAQHQPKIFRCPYRNKFIIRSDTYSWDNHR